MKKASGNNLQAFRNKVFEGDCLKILPKIPAATIDLILCDLPYGMTNNPWDKPIDLTSLWVEYKRIIKSNGAIILTSQGAFTGKLICSCPELFKYKFVWIKSKAGNFLNARKQPMRKHEDICVFYKGQPVFNPQKTPGLPYNRGIRSKQTGSYGHMPPANIVNETGARFPVDVLEYDDFIYTNNVQTNADRYYHPTQKPLELGRYLVRTYSNSGAIVLDNACGAGSFLVSAALEGRNFIGIELNQHCYKEKNIKVDFISICNERLKAVQQKRF